MFAGRRITPVLLSSYETTTCIGAARRDLRSRVRRQSIARTAWSCLAAAPLALPPSRLKACDTAHPAICGGTNRALGAAIKRRNELRSILEPPLADPRITVAMDFLAIDSGVPCC